MNPVDRIRIAADLSLPHAALALAETGLPVFPCLPRGKAPLIAGGFLRASVDARQVAEWWRRWPAANIGVPTGAASGVVVVDIDHKHDISGYPAFTRARNVGIAVGAIGFVRTPSGGMHAYYHCRAGQPQPCWQNATSGIDFRGDGGYIIVPPSRRSPDTHDQYTLLPSADREARALDDSGLRALLSPPIPRPNVYRRPGTTHDDKRLAQWVERLHEGERNHGLFWAACRMAENGASSIHTLDVLGTAAEHAGLSAIEIDRTILSAYRTITAASSPPPPDRTSVEEQRPILR